MSVATSNEAAAGHSSLVTRHSRWPQAEAMAVAAQLCAVLKPLCVRLVVAGSLRRRKPTVGDVEILYIGKTDIRRDPDNMFGTLTVNQADEGIAGLERCGVLERRRNVNGSETYGPKNKLMRHCGTGLPVDFFAATEENWFNYLVCRTGPAELNMRICVAADARGWKWNPYGKGFSRNSGLGTEERAMTSEEAVFAFLGMPYLKPEARV